MFMSLEVISLVPHLPSQRLSWDWLACSCPDSKSFFPLLKMGVICFLPLHVTLPCSRWPFRQPRLSLQWPPLAPLVPLGAACFIRTATHVCGYHCWAMVITSEVHQNDGLVRKGNFSSAENEFELRLQMRQSLRSSYFCSLSQHHWSGGKEAIDVKQGLISQLIDIRIFFVFYVLISSWRTQLSYFCLHCTSLVLST